MKKAKRVQRAKYYVHKKKPRRQRGFAERLTAVFRLDPRSLEKLAPEIGCAEASLRQWKIGVSEPPVAALAKLCQVTGTRIEWLVNGRGPRSATQAVDVQSVNATLLCAIIEQTEKSLMPVKVPVAKRAELIASLYELSSGRGSPMPNAATQLAHSTKRQERVASTAR